MPQGSDETETSINDLARYFQQEYLQIIHELQGLITKAANLAQQMKVAQTPKSSASGVPPEQGI